MFSKLRLGKKQSDMFGLDIGSSAVKVVQFTATDGALTLTNLGIVTLPRDVITEGSIKDPATVISAIKEAVAKSGVTGIDAAISICGRELIIKKVQIPPVPAKELKEAVFLEAEHHVPFAIDEVFLDFHVVNETAQNLDLILVAVKKSKVMEYVTVVAEAGFNPLVVDVDSFALSNAFEINGGEDTGEEAVALIDIGASVMKTNVMRNGASIFARDIPFGGNQYTQAIASRLGVEFEQAEAAKLGRDPNVEWESLAPAVEEISHELSLEVQRTFDYFASTAEAERIGKIILSGGCSQVPGLADYLASNWGIPVELARPFERIAVADQYADEVNTAGTALAVAVGLGLRKAGDKGK
jgi:type IV pilus assembly protein PilM